MNVYRNDNGDPVVRVPGTFWYKIVGKNRYDFAPIVHREIRNYDHDIEILYDFVGNIKTSGLYGSEINGSNSDSTKKLVKEDEDYVNCVNYYGRDKRGELIRFVDNIAFNMRRGTVVDILKETHSAFEIKKGYYIPFSNGEWQKVKKIFKNREVLFKNGKLLDLDYIVSEMIQYMQDNLKTQIGGLDMDVDGFDTKEIDNLIEKIESMIEDNTYKLPKNSDTENQVETNIEMYRKTHASFDKPVNHPSHYNHGVRETIDDIKEHLENSDWNAYQGGLLFNVYKYIDRAPYKGKRVEDLKKAARYLNKLIDEVGEK